jgi:chemotaxis protein methyltransferase CheR
VTELLRSASPPITALTEAGRAELRLLQEKIERERGFQCTVYKDKCLLRRMMVRMRARACETFAEYSDLLDRDAAEFDLLIDALTVNVTKFFRNLDTWHAIEESVLPELMSGDDARLRFWSAGCSSGEEPYSLAILLREWAERAGRPDDLRRCAIEGTDIDRASLAAADRAIYAPHSMAETPDQRRDRWFAAGPPYRLDAGVRAMVAFRHHDLIRDRPPQRCHLIVCRNVLIYFEREIQARVFEAFHDALLPGGFLVLGKAETLHGPMRGRFSVVNGRERVFRRPA